MGDSAKNEREQEIEETVIEILNKSNMEETTEYKLTNKRRVTVSDFRGKTLVSIRDYYHKDGKELPSSKGMSLTTEQWSAFKKNVPAIEKAIKKMSSR